MNSMIEAGEIDIAACFRARKVQYTPQRRQVWHFFASHPQGHTIGEAVAALKGVGIGQATVYRTVFLLLEMGLLHRLQDPEGKTCFVATRPGHRHPLICRACRSVVEFEACDLSVLEKLLSAETGYAVESHRLEVYGLCPQCRSIGEQYSPGAPA